MAIKIESTRTKKVVIGSASIAASQVLSSLMAFVLTGVLSRYFTSDQFGLWSLLMTFTTSFLGFDLGFGNALRNRLASSYSNGEASGKSKRYFLSVFYLFLLFSILIGLGSIALKPYVPWESLLKTQDVSLVVDGSSLFVIGVFITALSLGFGLNAAGFFSYQESHWNAVTVLISKISVLIGVIVFVRLNLSFYSINLISFVATLMASIMAFWFFLRKRNWSMDIIPLAVVRNVAKELWRKSVQFAALQFIAFIFVSVDLFLISKMFGLEAVGDYSLVKKLYVLVGAFHFAFLMPIWSAYTEAAASGDIVWIQRILTKTLFYTSTIFSFAGVGVYLLGDKFIYIWAGRHIDNPWMYLLLGVWALLTGVTNCFSVFLNSIGRLKIQILVSLVGIIAMFPLALWCGKIWGVNGVCCALIIANLPMALATSLQARMCLRGLRNGTV